MPADVSYLPLPAGWAGQGDVLGVIGLGALPPGLPPGCPTATLAMPVLAGGPAVEVWRGGGPVTWAVRDGIACAHAPDLVFGILAVDAAGDSAAMARDAYARLFRLIEQAGCPTLLRVHNYLPRITASEGGQERYRTFNAGRHADFAARGRRIETAPAACALGTADGPLLIYFLATAGEAHPIENPRQLSAYRYPPRYGPTSPTFSRGLAGAGLLFISGTASIVGHESLHVGDVAAQTAETVANVRALLAQSAVEGYAVDEARLRLKVYVRQAGDLGVVRERLTALLGQPGAEAVYLQADICRPELLMEVEGVCPLGPG